MVLIKLLFQKSFDEVQKTKRSGLKLYVEYRKQVRELSIVIYVQNIKSVHDLYMHELHDA